jgi:signal transduction histidine kinase
MPEPTSLGPQPQAARDPAGHSPVLRLLILEDVPEDAELEERSLRRAGIHFDALRVESRAGFLEALEKFRPDLIITDYKLPDIDGLSAIRLVRERDAELPIILVTGALDDESAVEVVKAGAYDYLRKDRLTRLPLAVEHALASVAATRSRRAAARMEAIGELTAGVAHDFNNLLQGIISNLEMVDDVPGVPLATQQCIADAIRISECGADLVHKLLSFARKHVMQPSAIELNEFLVGFRNMLARTLDPRIRVGVFVESDLLPVIADATHLHTALLNLAINARDAMPSGGDLRIEAVRSDGTARGSMPDEASDRMGIIRVIDTGTGMAPEILSKACEPFFSTKGLNGTGLGLSMVYGFAKQSGGDLRIFSEPSKGTCVELALPFAPMPARARRTSLASEARHSPGHRSYVAG